MDKDNFLKKILTLNYTVYLLLGLSLLIFMTVLGIRFYPGFFNIPGKSEIVGNNPLESDSINVASIDDQIENGIHVPTGFKAGEGLETVIQNCTACHSAKLVIQNRATREGWTSMIRWMQETQNLWDLGKNEEVIVDYLSRNYAPTQVSRRKNLENIDWYELEE